MKITGDDFARLSAAVESGDTQERRERYRAALYPRSAQVKDVDKRYRWDLFWEVRGLTNLDGNYSDEHIDTALRKIVPKL